MATVVKAAEVTVTTDVELKVNGTVKTAESTTVEANAGEVNSVHEEIPENTTKMLSNNVATVGENDVNKQAKKENGVVKEDEPEASAEKNAKETASGEAEENVAVIVEEKKEEASKVKLYQFPPGKHIPNTSPFCLKLETFLRIHNIPYENQYGYKMGKKGKLPWIEYKGERKADSNLIIDYLNEKFEVGLDKEFTSEQLSLGRATRIMLEENTYWALIYNRYLDNFNEFKKCISSSGSGIGFNISQKMFQRKMRSNLDGHGLGRHTKVELYSIAEQDLKAVSDLLGDKSYLLGDAVSSFDCALFGLCANVLYAGVKSPLSTYIKEHAANLIAFCERIKATYWHDWEEVILGAKVIVLGENAEYTLKESGTLTGMAPEKAELSKEAIDQTPPGGNADASNENVISEEKTTVPAYVPLSNATAETPAEEKPDRPKENKTENVTESNSENTCRN